jgi:ribosomal protein L16 Arg81 hydroxylase
MNKLMLLLKPFDYKTFITEYWEQKPLHIARQNCNFYKQLLSIIDLQNIISSTDMRYPVLKIFKNRAYLPPQSYTRTIGGSDALQGIPDVGRVQQEYNSGATIVLLGQHLVWPPLRALCHDLEEMTGHSIKTSIYITPPNSEAFTPHFDAHDVMVLQVAGKKTWDIYDSPIELPHRSQGPLPPRGYVPPKPTPVELDCGDLLYLPRGYIHSARTGDLMSAHITLGIQVYTWIELIAQMAEAAKGIPELRKALPFGFHTATNKTNLATALGLRLNYLDSIDKERVVDAFIRGVGAYRQSLSEEIIEL